MKTQLKYMGTVSILFICLVVLVGSASAVELSQGAPQQNPGYGMYPSPQGYGIYPQNQGQGCGAVDQSRYPGSTEFCTRWIAGHWVQVQVMVPGRWIYRPVWIPAYPRSQYRWVGGFWQTTGYNTRPDVYVWGTPNGRWYGMPYQTYQNSGGGYFGQGGVWMPQSR